MSKLWSDELPVSKPSQWGCRTPLEAKVMTDWVNAHLDRQQAFFDALSDVIKHIRHDEDKWSDGGETPDWAIAMMVVADAIKQADEKGDIEPLRKDLLHLTGHDLGRFLKRPERKRGEKFSKDNSNDRAKKAAADVRSIKQLWRQEFSGHHKRPKGDLVKAEDIAANRNKVSIAAIESKLKNPRRK
jgi:hypothetical protein